MAKRHHDDDDGNDGKGEKGESENFSRESPDSQPIRNRDSSLNPTIIANFDPESESNSPQSRCQPQLANKDAPPSIGDPSIPSSSPSHDPQSIHTNNAIIEDEIDGEIDPQSHGFNFWHRRLGHTSYRNLLKLGLIPRRDKQTLLQSCDACALEKQTYLPYRKYEHKAPRRLWRVHSDMSREQIPDIGESFKYFITFIDDYSHYCWVYFTKRKDAATIRSIYEQWQRDAINKANKLFTFLMTDGGGEYQKEMATILKDSETTHLQSRPYSPESNGLAERQNRTLKDTARTMMKQANMPTSFWAKAVKAACNIRNCLPHSSLKGIRSPHRAFFK
jgi:transposase InsO family protein